MRGRLGSTAVRLGVAIALAALLAPAAAAAKSGQIGSFGGVTVEGSPYRYAAFSARGAVKSTTVARIERDGGRTSRWWYLRGSFHVPAASYDPDSPGGLSADGTTLVLSRVSRTYPPRVSRFAILKTQFNYEWHGPGRPPRFRQFPKFIDVRGNFVFNAISPDGATLYLTRYRDHGAGPDRVEPGPTDDFEIRALDLESGKLAPRPLAVRAPRGQGLAGLPVTRVSSSDGRWAYTLQFGDRRATYLLALDTIAGRAIAIDLPRLKPANPFLLRLRLEAGGRRLTVFNRPPNLGGARALVRVDTSSYTVRPARSDTASIGMIPSWLTAERTSPDPLLAFARTPRRPGNLLARFDVIAHSTGGRPIEMRQLGDPAIDGEILVFGCIHGDECAGREIQPLTGGCPDPSADLYVVPNLDPDGAARGIRLNGRGVDLNRNFPAGWRSIGSRWDPQYSGPRPFSEPESRLAARIVRQLAPAVTIWFHQYDGSRAFVRAWGQSAPAGRHFARLAKLPFRLLAWPDGTAPNWQNHRFPGTSSFVVELPPGPLANGLASRLGDSIVRLGRKVGED